MSDEAVAALRAGQLVVLPTDTVYGLCADAYREAPCRRLHAAKQRPETMPMQLLAADLDAILDAVPEARGRGAVVARALLPGPVHADPPEPGAALPLAHGDEAGDDRRPRARPPGTGPRGREASRCGRGHEREPPRRARSRPPRGRPARDPRQPAAPSSTRASCRGRRRRSSTSPGPEPIVLREGAVSAEEALADVRRVFPGEPAS